MTTTYIDTFAEKLRNPDFFDFAGGTTSAADTFLKQLGETAKKVQTNALTAADAQNVKNSLAWFSDVVNRMNAQLANIAPTSGADSEFARYFKTMATKTNLAFQKLSYAADEIIAGNSASLQKFSAGAAAVLKQAGAFIGIAQIAYELGSRSDPYDLEKVGEKSAGVLAGYAAGEITAVVVVGVGAALSLPVIATAAAALVGAVAVGYAAGKSYETIWPTASDYYRALLSEIFSQNIPRLTEKISDATIKLGKFDGTWLEELENVTDEQKASFTSLISGVARIAPSSALNADIKKLFVANFTDEALVGRDALLTSILTFAKENGYARERVTANAANVTLDLPSFPTSSLDALRSFVQNQLSETDQRGFSLTGPSRIVIATAAGTHAASDTDSLLVGSDGVDGLIGGAGDDDLIAGEDDDTLLGGAGTDDLFGGKGDDVVDGGTGGDYLYGGEGDDTYQFRGAFGTDRIVDSDGEGHIEIDGKTLGTAKGAGRRGAWVAEIGEGSGEFADIAIYDDQASTTGKKLVITAGRDNTITINNFNQTLAEGAGYLGIKLNPTQRIAIVQGDGTSVGASKPNVWADNNFNSASLDGKSSNVSEGTGKAFNIYLAQGAKAGDTITLSLDGDVAAELKAKINGAIVDADGAVVTLTEGQTSVSFTLLQDEEITDDMVGNISASYEGEDDSVESNTWALTLKDAGEVDNTFNGDFLVKTETNIGAPINRTNLDGELVEVVGFDKIFYVRDNQGNLVAGSEDPTFKPIYDQDGRVIGQEEVPSDDETVTDNAIYGTAGKDKINGLTGKDLLSGGAGNDQIDGGAGDDMIGGGAGSDTIEGGDGNDYISSSANIQAGRQAYGPMDKWSQWGMPAGTEPVAYGGTWGVYVGDEAGGGKVTIWSGIGSTDTGSTDGDVIDAGAGDDRVIASWGDDRIMGGDGKDQLDGLAGNDIIEGGDGDDNINADGIAKAGYLNSVAAVSHGADFLDGGAGADTITGGGQADQLFGGAGDDQMWGDSGGKTDDAFYVELAYHGADYMDGEDGDDSLEGGGKDDTLYGGAGNDKLWGDTGADNIASPSDNAAMWGADYLDGEDGNDELVGGGKDDTLYGGKGDDKLFGDEQNIALKAEFQGVDYLDGEEGDDYLEGGAKGDTLFGGAGNDNMSGDAAEGKLAGADHGDDYLDGEDGDDNLSGDGGNDTLYGSAGKDNLLGDGSAGDLAGEFHGADYLDGGAEDDYLEGGGGSDTLIGGTGKDYLAGDIQGTTLAAQYHGDDTLDGGDGDDTLIGGGGNDTLVGGTGDDFISGDDALSSTQAGEYAGNDTIDGGTGNDTVLGGKGDDTITGGDGNDLLFGGEGDDTLTGGAGNDRLTGGTGRNVMDGGEGDDSYIFKRGDGFAQITDGSGFNRLYLEPGMQVQDVRFSLGSLKITTGTAGDEIHIEGFDPADPLGSCAIQEIVFLETGRVYSLPQLLAEKGFDLGGTEQADSIIGTALVDRITTGAGDDNIAAQEGNDTINAGAGDDYVDGGDGNDTVQAGDGNDVLETNAGIDSLDGGVGDDLYVVGSLAGNTTIADAAGADTLVLDWDYADVQADADMLTLTHRVTGQVVQLSGLEGSGHQDVSAIENFQFRAPDGSALALAWDHVFYGRTALLGTTDGDALVGTAGDDLLIGLGGNDGMTGGDGNDTLRPGAGLDRLEGGAGDDVYVLSQTAGNKVVFDAAGVDTLTLGWRPEDLGFDVQDNAFVNLVTGQRVKIEGFDISQGAASCPIETFEMSDGSGGLMQLSAEQLFDRGFDVVGTPFNDAINGTVLKERIYALASDDVVNAGGGNDSVYGDGGNDVLRGEDGNDSLDGADGNDQLLGGLGDDGMFGGLGNDLLDGGEGADIAYGWYGADTYVIDNELDTAVDQLAFWSSRTVNGETTYDLLGNDIDAVASSVDFALGQGLDNLTLTGSEAINGTGNWFANTITGNDADNVIVGTALNGGGDQYGQNYYYSLTNGAGNVLNPETQDQERAYDMGQRAIFQNRLESDGSLNLIYQDGTPFDGNVVSQQGDMLIGGGGNDALYGDVDNDTLEGGTGDDLLAGGGGNDLLIGGLGDDTYVIDGGHSARFGAFTLAIDTVGTLVEQVGEGSDTVLSARDWVLADNFENLTLQDNSRAVRGTGNAASNVITASSAGSLLFGLGGDDVIIGKGGNDTIDGGEGADTMSGGGGNDIFVVDSLADTIVEQQGDGTDSVLTVFDTTLQVNLENLTLADGSTATIGIGNTESNVIVGNQNDNALDGGSDGFDVLYGGAGNDSLRIGYGLLYGQEGNDTLIAGDGDNTLDGGTGADIMDGGQGSDTYLVDDLGDVTSEATSNYGIDSVTASVSHAIGQGIENLNLTGYNDTFGIGNELNNTLLGNDGNNLLVGDGGNDSLDGGYGLDTLVGGSGDDSYFVERDDEVIIEAADEGYDSVVASSSYALSENIEDLTLLSVNEYGPAANLVGNSLSNRLTANISSNSIEGRGGNDTIDAQAGYDWISGGDGDDVIYGGSDAAVADFYGGSMLLGNDDRIYGDAGNDVVDGGSGNDYLEGGAGDDILFGGRDRDDLDTRFNVGGGGGYGGYGGSGVGLLPNDDYLDGGEGADNLDGGSGNDILLGGAGNDFIYGGSDGGGYDTSNGYYDYVVYSNNDYLDGGEGIDTMLGGTGDDTYVVDGTFTANAEGGIGQVDLCDEEHRFGVDRVSATTWVTDTVQENAYEGFDTVNTTASVNLLGSFEVVNLLGSGPVLDIDAFTGAGDQTINGNAGNNRLGGGEGSDTLVGGAGNDTYWADADDTLVELDGEGFDTVHTEQDNYVLAANFEGLVLEGAAITGTGNSSDNALIGNDQSNVLLGGSGSDTLAGWRGNDLLQGGEGNDTYAFSRGDGQDTIDDLEGSGKLHFSGDITRADLRYSLSGNDLVINVAQAGNTTTDSVTLKNWVNAAERTNVVAFCGGDTFALDESIFNHAPVAVADVDTAIEDIKLVASGNVLSNDADEDAGTVLQVTNGGSFNGLYGSLILQTSGAYAYTLNNNSAVIQALKQGQVVTESFAYSITDGDATKPLGSVSTLTVRITGTNDMPVVTADNAEVVEDCIVQVTGNALVNDLDVDGDTLSVANFGTYQSQRGQLVLRADGSYVYTLDNASSSVQSLRAGERTTDVFAVVTTDGIANVNSQLTIGITGTNDVPVAVDDTGAVREDSQPSVTGSVLTNDSDRDANTLLTVTNPGNFAGQYGTLKLLANGNYSYTLANSALVQALAMGQIATDSFAYTATDGLASSSARVVIKITGENDGPIARADVANVVEDTSLQATGNVLTNDTDPDTGDTLKVGNPAAFQGQYGSLVLRADGSYTYTLNNSTAAVQALGKGEQVADTFAYTVTDAHATGALTAQANLVVTIAGSNDAPLLKLPIADISIRAKTVFTLDLPDNTFTDIDRNDVLGYTLTLSNGQPTPSWLTFNANGLVIGGTPPKELSGQNIELRLTAVDRFGASANDVFKIAVTSCVGLTLVGGCGDDRLVGTACDDSLDGRQGSDTMIGGDGDDIYYVDQSSGGCEAGDVVTEYLNQGYDKVFASTSYTLAQNVEALELTGCNNLSGTGNTLNNWIVGNSGANTLDGKEGNDLVSAGDGNDCVYGGTGNDVLEGLGGSDTLEGGDGVDALFGGSGNDTLRSGAGKGLLAGGKGSDALYAANAATVVAFNKGDGVDTLYTSGSEKITLSLGGGLKYEDIKISRSGKDLFLNFNTNATDRIKVANYYGTAAAQRPTFEVQMLTEPSSSYLPTGTDVLRDNKVERFNGTQLIADFDRAYQTTSSLRSGNAWAVMGSLLNAHLGGSNTAGIGGDLAYQYGQTAGLAGMGMVAASNVLSDTNFGASPQTLNSNLTTGVGSPRLAG